MDEVEAFLKKIPGISAEVIERLPVPYIKAFKLGVKDFFVDHQLTKEALKACSFDAAFRNFGESQQAKGRTLTLIDVFYKDRLISAEESNAMVGYLQAFNDTKIREFLENIKSCEK